MNVVLITNESDCSFVSRCLKIQAEIVVWEYLERVNVVNWEEKDCIVVAIKDSIMRKQIIKIMESFVSKNSIIDFWQFYGAMIPFKRCDRVMMNPNITDYKGLIFGVSYAELGILSSMLDVPFANLAVSSQDIYYNNKVLKHVLKKYAYKLNDIQYVIFDMYRYTYFNFDVSSTNIAKNYFSYSGIYDDPHHYDRVKYDNIRIDFLEKRFEGITLEKIAKWKEIFKDVHKVDNYRKFQTFPKAYTRNNIVTDDEVIAYDFNRGIVRNHFDLTIQENIRLFQEILVTIKENWPNCRIILMHMPMYELAYKRCEGLVSDWKIEFADILHQMKRYADFEYIDYTLHDLSKKQYVWQDWGHLNYYGAIEFTRELNEKLKKIDGVK